MASARFDFNDFLSQFERINNMGGLKMLKLMPGFSGVSEKQLYEVEKKFKMYSALISSMTPEVGGRAGAGLRALWGAAARPQRGAP
jgi:signal recognition particle GTPase